MRKSGITTSKDEPSKLPTIYFTGGDEERLKSDIMTVQEVAAYLRISRFSVYNLVKRGELPAMKILNKFRFSLDNVEHYLNTHKINRG